MKNLITLTLTVVAITSLPLNASESGAYNNVNDGMQRTITYERPGIVRGTENVVTGTSRAAGNAVEGAGNVAGRAVEGAGNVVTGTIGGFFGGGKRKENAQRDAEDRKKRKEEDHKKTSKDLRGLGGLDKD
jgi:hypothetical protein